MHRIKFKITRNGWEEKDIAETISVTIAPASLFEPYLKTGEDHRWVLDANNDWFMSYDPESKEVELAYRYAAGFNNEAIEAIVALGKWLEWNMN